MTAGAPSRRPSPKRANKTERLDLRLSRHQKDLLERAAAATQRTVTDFVVQSAAIAAQDALADRTRFVLPPGQWAAFTEALDREPRSLPRLAALLTVPSVLEAE